ncbi:uncharacterized protein LOC133195425 [Saccostrea echinata]|uniref:uncharacterized protein LOC133195425 n=1 Tax=Saccostrea echinata TaxID=191078 RepID=UPI002A7EF900|nr:uncharacterized protein LOC133195425 [Saccostrea echinata]
MYLKPLEIRFSQDSIGRTFGRCTSHPFRPIGNTLDDILSGRCNINSIPNISVVKRDGLWFTSDNRRLWVFQEAEKRGKCSEIYVRETSYFNYSKFTTANNGTSIYVRGNPGGSLWRRMPEVSRSLRESAREVSTMYSKTFTRTSTNINTEINTRQIDQDMSFPLASYRQGSLVNTNLAFPKPSEDDSSETSSDCEQNYTVDVRDTNGVFPKPAEDDTTEKSSECEQNYPENVRESKVEEMEGDFDKQSDSLPEIADVNGNSLDEEPSMGFSSKTYSDCLPLQQSREFSNNFYDVSLADDAVKIPANEIVATTEHIKGTVMENKIFVGDEEDVEDNKSRDGIEKEETNEENKIARDQISKISNSELLNYRKEHFILNMEHVSGNPPKKRTSTKRIICVSFITIVLLTLVFFLIYILYSILSSEM